VGSASRGVFGVFAPKEGSGVIILIRPRGAVVSGEARSALQCHPLAAELSLTLEAVATWEDAHARVGKLLPLLQRTLSQPVVALAQTRHDLPALLDLIPQLKQLPAILVPQNGADTASIEDASLALGGAWQSRALALALDRYSELASWWTQRVYLARHAGIPIGCLPRDAVVYAIDIQMHRRLLQIGHLSWLSPSSAPDFGGHPANYAEGCSAEEVTAEVTNPGMYRSVCIELQLDNLAVNTILEARHVHMLEGSDLTKDLVRSVAAGDPYGHVPYSATAAPKRGETAVEANDDVSTAMRVLRLMLSEWMRNVLHQGDTQADAMLMNFYRWLSSTSSLLYDPALHRMVQLLMKKVWTQLLAEVCSLGATIIYASFTRLVIASSKTSLTEGQAYVDFVLSSLSAKPIFSFLRVTPMRFWSSLLFLDAMNFGGLAHARHHPAEVQSVYTRWGMDSDAAAAAQDVMSPDDGAGDSAAERVSATPVGDLHTVEQVALWNVAFHLPPLVQGRFMHLIQLYVTEPWLTAAGKAEACGRASPSPSEVEYHAVSFVNEVFAMKLLEDVDQIRRTIPSTGPAERQAIHDGTASDEVALRSFPNIPGSHLDLADAALEFVKGVCHLCSFEACIGDSVHRMRKNALKMIKVKEFAIEGCWTNPSLSFVLHEVVCESCGHCRDLDLCREELWACCECGNAYVSEYIESRLVLLVQRRASSFQIQDTQCAKCKAVKRSNLAACCQKCAGPFALRQSKKRVANGLAIFGRIAEDHHMSWLAETIAFANSR